ncbi:MAG: hypothetical protein M1816_000895 [Peltula sp. TS41687]|nr:MAG: hypothetical protein M1816_000895 [Peltula sp. TS41687]
MPSIPSSIVVLPDLKPTPGDWTLRLKQHKTTIFMSVTPTTEFPIIKRLLLYILTSTYPSGEFNGQNIPSNPEHVVLAVPKDPEDLRNGWLEVADPEQDTDGTLQGANRRRSGGRRSILNNPQGVGLENGAVMAFKFREGGARRKRPGEVKEEEGEEEEEEEEWDVVFQSFEDEYGSQS